MEYCKFLTSSFSLKKCIISKLNFLLLITDFWCIIKQSILTSILFFSYRPLEYVCANTTALCRMHISRSQPDPTKDEVVFTAQVNDVMLPVVSMSGLLQLCIGPSLMFRKRPLVQDSELSCHVWHKEDDPSPEGYKLYPNYEGMFG